MKKYFGVFLVLGLVLLNIYIWSASTGSASEGFLTVAFLDVGQGDSIFIESPTGVQVLIDSGANNSVLRELGKVMSFQDRTIDVLLATHPDKDHVGGFPAVLVNYDVNIFIDNGASAETGIYREVENAVDKEGVVELLVKRGMILDLGGGALLTILFPDRDISGGNTNDGSIITKLEYGGSSFLLTGDSPKKIEEYLVSLDGEYLDVDVLKAGHHGSKTSSSEAFINLTSPEYAVISAGKDNRYGHPHEVVIETLNKQKANILATYNDGMIVFLSDGEKIWLK